MTLNIGYIVGSASSQSINRKLINGLIELASEEETSDSDRLRFVELTIDDLPIYNYDLDGNFPAAASEFKSAIRSCDGLVIATPEYNRSIPGMLKNAIDWASRPYGDNAFQGKPVGIIGASVGAVGTATAQQHLRNILAYLNAPTLGQPEVFIQYSPDRFADDGSIKDIGTRQFFVDWLAAYRQWIVRFSLQSVE
jgi:chromate reductase, NAD(P)H dehydrogenase (quinone)